MLSRFSVRVLSVLAVLFCLFTQAYAASGPEDDLAGQIKLILSKGFSPDWQGIEKLPGIKWAPLPPTMLDTCLPDGGCFTRQGTLVVGGRNLLVLASGARTMVTHIYFRNAMAPLGEGAVVAALKQKGFSLELARCPAKDSLGGTNWYRLKGVGMEPGYLSIQTSCNGKACEGFVLSLGEELPPLQPNQLKLYSEKCSAGSGEERTAVSTVMPFEALAEVFVKLMPPAAGPALYDWKTLMSLLPGAKWSPGGAKKGDLSFKSDPNPWMLSGQIVLAQREFSVLGSGLPTQVKVVYFDENGMHARGEDLLGSLRKHGFEVRLVRCGPVYTESTNNWYSLTSAGTQPVMLLQSLRQDGARVQDAYAIRLDNTLPVRDSRDRNPGVNGCK